MTRRCNDREVVVSVVQDTFVAVWKDARKWRGDGDVAGWLWGIAFRRMVSQLRSRKQVVLMPDWEADALGRMPAAEDEVLLGVRENTVRTRLHRAKAQLRQSLAEQSWAEPTGGWQ